MYELVRRKELESGVVLEQPGVLERVLVLEGDVGGRAGEEGDAGGRGAEGVDEGGETGGEIVRVPELGESVRWNDGRIEG